ncbi:hypothetical protein N9L24_02240 [Candidatus Marinamargulisbacteria bacterium]|jgi:outer membrane protein TolC|nr:hypothetical protein [Candidatus Marinamargulisbacteria bacterium]
MSLKFCLYILGFSISVLGQPLSLDAYLAHIDQHSAYLKSTQKSLEQHRDHVETERRKSGWVVSGKSYWDQQDPNPPNRLFMSQSRTTHTGIATQLTKPIWQTGGQIGLSHELRRMDQSQPLVSLGGSQQPLQPNPLYTRSAGLSYRQPLLQNRWGTQSERHYKLAKNNQRYQAIIQAESEESFRLEYVLHYLTWAHYYTMTTIMRDRLAVAVALYTENQAKYTNNLIDTLDILQSQHYLNQQQTHDSQAKLLLETHQNKLSAGLNYPAIRVSTPTLDLYQIPNLNTEPMPQSLRIVDALKTQQAGNHLMYASIMDQKRPQLDLVVQAQWHDSINEHNRITDYGLMDKQVVVQFSTPLGLKPVAAELDALKHDTQRIQHTIDHELNQLMAHKAFLESEYRRLRVHYEYQTTAVALHTQTVKEENRLYEQGRRNLTFVLQSQDAEHAAKLAMLDTAYQLHCIVAQHNALLDRLQ